MLQATTVATESPPTRYSGVAIVLHWMIAALLLGEVALGLRMEGLHGAPRFALFQLHKSIGITILLLVALRVLWRWYRVPPPIAASGWQLWLARGVHALLYLLMFALPLTGWSIVSTSRIAVSTLLYGTVPLPHLPGMDDLSATARGLWNTTARWLHINLVLVLYGGFALHLAGALRHQWFDRDGDLARMAPGVRPGRAADPVLLAITAVALVIVGIAAWAPLARSRSVPTAAPALAAARVTSAASFRAPTPSAAPPTSAQAAAPLPADSSPAAATTPSIPAAVSAWLIQSGSTLHWRTTWSGDTIDGGFNHFQGSILFSPDALDRSHVALTIDTASVFSGDAQRDDTLKSADWFSTAAAPSASYTAAKFHRVGPDRYIAMGMLRLKGTSLPVPVTFTLNIVGDVATMHGTATVDRTAFRIGEGEFAATTDLPAAVTLDITVTAKRR